jgi:hypothetical protein
MDYDEPEPLPFAARHWLGAALIEAGRAAEAEEHYRDPDVDADFDMSTARMDVWITASKF